MMRMEQSEVEKYLKRDHKADMEAAAERLKGIVRHTPLIHSDEWSDRTGAQVYLKPENLQKTGSFKLRGAYNKIASMSDAELSHGVVTASAGNHAQGVAYGARERHAKAIVVMPDITPPLKVDATQALGAEVVLHGHVFDESNAFAIQLAKDRGMTFIPPFDDYDVLCGQGTIAMEILQDLPEVTDIIVPLGGGGLGAGIAMATKIFRPDVRVIGAIPIGSPAFKESFHAGHVVEADEVHTIAEGVAVKHPGDLTFALLSQYLDGLVQVSERDIYETIMTMMEKHKLVVEGAGAVSVAALGQLELQCKAYNEASTPHVIVPVLSGGNIDTVTIGAVIQQGMISRGRIMSFSVELPDVPGQLVNIARILADLRANVIELTHDQFKADTHYANKVVLEVTVETNGPDHITQVLETLRGEGYDPKQIF